MADCSKIRTTGHWKGHPCGSPGLYLYNGAWTCANHFPIDEALGELARIKRAVEYAKLYLKDIESTGAPYAAKHASVVLAVIEKELGGE